MNFTTILPLLSAILVFLLGLFVLNQDRKKRVNFTFALFTFAISIWMIGTFMMFINKESPKDILFWDKFVYIGVVFIPAIMFHFGLAFTDNKIVKQRILLYLGYLFSLIFLLLIPGDLFVSGAFTYKWGAHSQAQFFHHIFLIYFFVYLSLWFVIVYKYYKISRSSLERERAKYCFLAFFILAIFGTLGYLPAYGFGIYPFSYISGVIFSVILAYAIIVHRLMDIKFVLRKSSVYLASFSIIVIMAIGVKYLVAIYFHEITAQADFVILILSIIAFSPIKSYFYKIANKYFFSSLYDSRAIIAEITEKLRATLEVKKIYNFIYETLNKSLHPKAFAILSYNQKGGYYVAQYNQGFDIGKRKKFLENERLHNLFVERNKTIVVEEVKNKLNGSDLKEIIKLLAELKIEILAPLNIKDKTVGLIVMGQKESGDIYNDEDLQVLEIIGGQAAMAIENAVLYEETLNFNYKLKKEIEKATSDLRKANDELKKLDEAKSEFISIASHQLRTPLTVIKGYISMILEGSFGPLSPAITDSLKKVYESGERLIQLVENLLNISRIESGRLQFSFAPLNFENMVLNVIDELSGAAQKKKIIISFKAPEKPLPTIIADEEKIRQVVMNLIDNAIKYTKKGNVTVRLDATKDDVKFSVSDNGMGIGPDDLPYLFKKFNRGKGTSIVHTEGTGLGLYVAKQMIETHQGKIWAESRGENKGATFSFELPIENKQIRESHKE